MNQTKPEPKRDALEDLRLHLLERKARIEMLLETIDHMQYKDHQRVHKESVA